MSGDTYGHTPVDRMFGQRDVYGIGYDEGRAARKPLRLGMVGAGGVAQSKHRPAIARPRTLWEPVVVAAVVEPDARQGKKIAELYGCRRYPDLSEMLATEELDGVEILSPDNLHVAHALACLEASLPVLVEKPLAPTVREARQLCVAADQRGILLMSVANKRYAPPYHRAKQLIDTGVIGVPNLLSGKLFDEEFGGYLGQIENFLQAIRREEAPLVTGWDGYRACELVAATRRSAETGTPMPLPLDDETEVTV